MRIYTSAAIALGLLGCSEPHLDLHLVRCASSPIKNEFVASTPCNDCVAQSWGSYDGSKVDLMVERDPYLSVPRHRLSEAEIIHGKWLYRPYCDSFVLSLRIAISVAEMNHAMHTVGNLPSLAIASGRPVDAGRQIFRGETLTLVFGNREQADDVAALLGVSPSAREADDHWRAAVRQQRLALLEELFSNLDELRRFAEQHGVPIEGLKREYLADRLFCP